MTEQPTPTSVPTPPAPQPVTWSVRRALRTADAETWDLLTGGDERSGTVTVHYAPDTVEGVLAVPATVGEDVRGMLGWLTELLALDHAAGPGGLIHWTVSRGEVEDFWRRSPGRRPTGAEQDLGAARVRVHAVLAQMFGEPAELPDGVGWTVDAGSVRVFVHVLQVEAAVLVRVFSITNVDVPLDGELPAYLLGLNFGLPVGRFSIEAEKRSVWFDHVLSAEQLDDGTLSRVVGAVAGTADRYDDEIKQRFGGRTFREEGSPVAEAAAAGMAGGYL